MRLENLGEGARLAFDQLRANKGRSLLTILGLVVGVATVMAMSAMISGVRTSVLSGIQAAGPNNFMIARFDFYAPRINSQGPPWGRNPRVTPEEATRIAALSGLRTAIPGVNASGDMAYGGNRIENVQIAGRGAGWSLFNGGTFTEGHDFLPSDVAASRAVAVITDKLAVDLFGHLDPIGRRVRLRGQSFEIIGVYRMDENIFAEAAKHLVLTPYTSALKYLDADREMLIIFAVPAAGVTQDAAMDQVITTLRSTRGLRPGQENDFAVMRQEEAVKTFNKITGIFFLVMIALSSVGLMVGGVGVIAIMMIAVTERTREIGIRKALGATRREILWQFLIEAVTVTVIGAGVGMLLGGAGAALINGLTPIPARVPFGAVIAALVMAAVAGVLFGLWPAWRASKMDPVVALRYE